MKNKYNKYNEYTNKKYKIYNKNNIKNNITQEGGSINTKSNFENINFYNKKVYENNIICLINN
jgi:hypothetical protein